MSQHDQSAVRSTSRVLVNAAALLLLGGAAIHFAVVPEHLEEYLLFGLFFIVVGAVQVAMAAAVILRPSRRLFLAALALSVGVAGLWLLSRTAGLPIGPHPGQPEAIRIPDLVCTSLEVVTALVLLVLVMRKPRGRRSHPVQIALSTAPIVLAVGLLTAVGVGSAVGAMPMASSATNAKGHVSGSSEIGQLFTRPQYFHGRPSSSGLDPNISPAYATLQVPRVARARAKPGHRACAGAAVHHRPNFRRVRRAPRQRARAQRGPGQAEDVERMAREPRRPDPDVLLAQIKAQE